MAVQSPVVQMGSFDVGIVGCEHVSKAWWELAGHVLQGPEEMGLLLSGQCEEYVLQSKGCTVVLLPF